MKILSCNSNRPLAEAIAAYLDVPLTKADVKRFADMEVFVEIGENVRGEDVFVVQSTCFPANDNVMELLVALDALRRGSARRITAVIPYYGYARQDRKSGPRTPISAKLLANLITSAGADRVLTIDLHAGQIQGFFDIPTDNLFAAPVFVSDIKERYDGSKLMIVSPDVGGVARARELAKRINAPLSIVDKRRERPGEVAEMRFGIFIQISIKFLSARSTFSNKSLTFSLICDAWSSNSFLVFSSADAICLPKVFCSDLNFSASNLNSLLSSSKVVSSFKSISRFLRSKLSSRLSISFFKIAGSSID